MCIRNAVTHQQAGLW